MIKIIGCYSLVFVVLSAGHVTVHFNITILGVSLNSCLSVSNSKLRRRGETDVHLEEKAWIRKERKNVEREERLTGLLGYTLEMWLFSRSTVQLRKQLMVWSSYFWLGALMIRVTGLSTAQESMAHITSRAGSEGPERIASPLRTHLRSKLPQSLSIPGLS